MKKNILVTATIHGNEQFGLKVVGALHQKRDDIHTLIAHPEAVAKNVRFIETDLNRSFNGKKDTLEERVAQSIMKRVDSIRPDIVIDLHTSVSDCGAVGIVTGYSKERHQIAEACGMKCMVIMKPTNSFIDQFSVPAIALEFGKNLRSDKLAQTIAHSVESLLRHNVDSTPTIPVYKMDTVIDKDFSGLAKIKNLVYNDTLGGYPFLAGVNTYEDIGGFLLQQYEIKTARN